MPDDRSATLFDRTLRNLRRAWTDLSDTTRHYISGQPRPGLPDEDLAAPLGLIVADASGSLIFRKQVEGFAVPRFGSSCPLWPVFAALGRPNVPLRRVITQEGRGRAMFTAFAVAHPIMAPDFDNDPLYHATMLLVPTQADDNAEGARVQSVGTTCRVCPVARCAARREVSVLGEEF